MTADEPCCTVDGSPRCDDCPAAPPQPPAETQQGDEPLVGAADRAAAREVVSAWIAPGQSMSPLDLDRLRAGIAAALAARPSADRDALRGLADRWSSLCVGVPARGSYDNGLYVGLLQAARELRATLRAADEKAAS